MTDTSSMLFEIADTFSMEVSRRKGPPAGALSGKERIAWKVMQGLNWEIEPKIVDSGYYPESEKAGALLRVTGSLYLLLLIDGTKQDEDYARLWVLDGAKLEWLKRTTLLVFPSLWKRVLLYEQIQDGVVAAFRRKRKTKTWLAVEHAAAEVREYVQAKQTPGGGETDAEKVLRRIRTDLNAVSDKFRTLGPRGA